MRISKKMRGVIDPYTLGFLLSIIGAITTHAVHSDDAESTDTTAIEAKSMELTVIAPDENDVYEETP